MRGKEDQKEDSAEKAVRDIGRATPRRPIGYDLLKEDQRSADRPKDSGHH